MKKAKQIADDFLSSIRDRIVAVLPREKDPDIYVATIAEYLTRNRDLFQCDRFSLEDAVIDAAVLGFEIGPPFDLASIIPYKSRRDNGDPVATLVIEYRGHMARVYRSGAVKSIESRAVYEHDEFSFEFGRRPVLRHQPTIIGTRGPLVYAYAIAQLTDGGSAMEVITKHDAMKARADSPNSDRPGSLWERREPEMWQKTVIKKLVNRLPRSSPVDVGTGTDPPVADYEKLVNAVCISPDLYHKAIAENGNVFPADSQAVNSILTKMRSLYKSKEQNGPQGPTEPPKDGPPQR